MQYIADETGFLCFSLSFTRIEMLSIFHPMNGFVKVLCAHDDENTNRDDTQKSAV